MTPAMIPIAEAKSRKMHRLTHEFALPDEEWLYDRFVRSHETHANLQPVLIRSNGRSQFVEIWVNRGAK